MRDEHGTAMYILKVGTLRQVHSVAKESGVLRGIRACSAFFLQAALAVSSSTI